MTGSLTDLAQAYFGDLARRFPVMCASDEFHFLPRAAAASEYFDRLDDLGANAIDEGVQALKDFQRKLNTHAAHEEDDLEGFLDGELLKCNVAGVLIDLEESRSYRHNPLLYLKIACIGLDHALTKPASSPEEITERTAARLDAIPRLLHQAIDNLEGIPETHHQAALLMLGDCKKYLVELSESFLIPSSYLKTQHSALTTHHSLLITHTHTQHSSFNNRLERVHSALNDFGNFLGTIRPVPDQDFGGPGLDATLREHFGSLRTAVRGL